MTYLILGALIASFATAWVAKRLGRNPYAWGIPAFFFGIVTILVLVCVHVIQANSKYDS